LDVKVNRKESLQLRRICIYLDLKEVWGSFDIKYNEQKNKQKIVNVRNW